MWIADNWKDYAVLDCGGGEKVERWGSQVLVRPDPQAIWPREASCRAWDKPNAVYHRSNAGGGHWEIRKLPQQWAIPLRRPDLPAQAHELQAHRPVSRAGGQLGFH